MNWLDNLAAPPYPGYDNRMSANPCLPSGLPHQPGRAFTLIELLVVLAIISILTAMLVPAAGIVRDMSRSVKCQANLRQYGVANSAYAMDWDGFYVPVCVTDASASVITRWDLNADFMNRLQESDSASTTGYTLTKSLICPTNVAAKRGIGVNYCYSANFTVVGGLSAYTASTAYTLISSKIKSGAFMIADGAHWKVYNTNSSYNPFAWVASMEGTDQGNMIALRHRWKSNAVLFDGSVAGYDGNDYVVASPLWK